MLTAKENMREVIKGGNPDRLVNQYEAMNLLVHPLSIFGKGFPTKGGPDIINDWGVTYSFPENVPGGFPVHTPDKIVIQDIENWRDYVKAPSLDFTDEQWAVCEQMYANADPRGFKAVMVAPGLFEHCHHLMSIGEALMAYYEYPDEMHELINYIADWEVELAKLVCDRLHPEMVFHHDDWGSEMSSFLSPEMFEEFFLEPYQRIYGYYKSHGVEFIVHHSDSYCANLMPTMIKMGIDVFQGCMKSNDNPKLISLYGGQMTMMGDIDNKFVDFEGWTPADCQKATLESIERCLKDNKYYIPCITQGGPGSVYPGTYAEITKAIDQYNIEHYGFTQEELDAARPPIVIMF